MRSWTGLAAVLLAAAPLLADSAGGLRWNVPGGWKPQPARPMRAATYIVPATSGDSAPGECAVFYFGRGQGGSVTDNIERWRSQILGADGKPAPAKIDKRAARGLTITVVDAAGAYTGMGGPMAGTTRAVPGFRLLGAVVEGPGGNNVFVKFTGPVKTVAANQAKFEQLLASFEVER